MKDSQEWILVHKPGNLRLQKLSTALRIKHKLTTL